MKIIKSLDLTPIVFVCITMSISTADVLFNILPFFKTKLLICRINNFS